jgi:hypothetical protein
MGVGAMAASREAAPTRTVDAGLGAADLEEHCPKGHRTGSSQVRLRPPSLLALLGCPDTRTQHSTPDTWHVSVKESPEVKAHQKLSDQYPKVLEYCGLLASIVRPGL